MEYYKNREDLWKNFAIFLKTYIDKKEVTLTRLSALTGIHRNTLRTFFQLKSPLSFQKVVVIIDALGLNMTVNWGDDDKADASLTPRVLEIEETFSINKSRLPVLKDQDERFFAILDLCDVLKRNYTYEIRKIRRDETLSSEMFLAQVMVNRREKREVLVMSSNMIFRWFFTIPSGTIKKHKFLTNIRDELSLKLRELP